MALALGLVLAVSIQDLTPENVLPVWVSDLPGAAAATLVPLGVAGAGVFMAFLGGQITVVEGDRRRCSLLLSLYYVYFADTNTFHYFTIKIITR